MPVFHTGDSCLASAVVACEAHDEGDQRAGEQERSSKAFPRPPWLHLLLSRCFCSTIRPHVRGRRLQTLQPTFIGWQGQEETGRFVDAKARSRCRFVRQLSREEGQL